VKHQTINQYKLNVIFVCFTGLRGLMLAALLAALMSSLTSILNSASSIMTMDLWRQFRKTATQSELMIVGRVTVLVLVIVTFSNISAISWRPAVVVEELSRSTRREPPVMGKQLLNFITCGCESIAPFFVIYKIYRSRYIFLVPTCTCMSQ
jgi:hypothetical protein